MPRIGDSPPQGKIVAGGMLREGTPIEDYRERYGLWVKREDLACPPPGPPFSKTRGVYERVRSRPEGLIGVLDTAHSQAGHAVARACQILGKKCVNFYPVYKHERDDNDPPQHELRKAQLAAQGLGATLIGLPAGRSCILYHQARKQIEARGGYMMPNALKLEESVRETAREVPQQNFDNVIIPISSGTIAAGVIRGFSARGRYPTYLIHLGYSRSHEEVRRYLLAQAGVAGGKFILIDEKYAYKDEAKPGETPPWPCNVWYDLKAFRWWIENREKYQGSTLFWNIG